MLCGRAHLATNPSALRISNGDSYHPAGAFSASAEWEFYRKRRVKLPVERSSGYSLVQEREPTLAVGTFPEYRQMAGGIDGRLVMGIIYSRCQLLMTTIVLLVRMPVGV